MDDFKIIEQAARRAARASRQPGVGLAFREFADALLDMKFQQAKRQAELRRESTRDFDDDEIPF